MDSRAWQATVRRVTKSRTWLKWVSTLFIDFKSFFIDIVKFLILHKNIFYQGIFKYQIIVDLGGFFHSFCGLKFIFIIFSAFHLIIIIYIYIYIYIYSSYFHYCFWFKLPIAYIINNISNITIFALSPQ